MKIDKSYLYLTGLIVIKYFCFLVIVLSACYACYLIGYTQSAIDNHEENKLEVQLILKEELQTNCTSWFTDNRVNNISICQFDMNKWY